MICTHKDYPGLVYDSVSGEMNWAEGETYRTAFSIDSRGGHLRFHYRAHGLYVHRLCWLFHYGEWPAHTIDHINGVPDDNAIANLRDVPHVTNMRNCKLRADNTTGHPGVYWHTQTQKWQAKTFIFGKGRSLGLFDTREEAAAAREEAMYALGYHENHGRETAAHAQRLVRKVRYAGACPVLKGSTGLRNSRTGRTQLDPIQDPRMAPYKKNPFCYGWHEIGEAWETQE